MYEDSNPGTLRTTVVTVPLRHKALNQRWLCAVFIDGSLRKEAWLRKAEGTLSWLFLMVKKLRQHAALSVFLTHRFPLYER